MAGEHLEVVRGWMAGFDRDGLPPLELCEEGIEIVNAEGFMVQGVYHGHRGVGEWVNQAFDVIEDRRVELRDTIDAGDGETVVTTQRIYGRSGHTGLDISLRWAARWTVRQGKVARVQGYLRKREALEAAGLPNDA